VNKFYISLFHKDRSYNAFRSWKIVDRICCHSVCCDLKSRTRCRKKKSCLILRGSVLPKLLQKSTISYFLEGIYRGVQTRIAKRWFRNKSYCGQQVMKVASHFIDVIRLQKYGKKETFVSAQRNQFYLTRIQRTCAAKF